MGRILAIDYGKKRTGLAVTDILRLTANPLTTIPTGELIPWLRNELNKGEIDLVIIGKPTQMNGQESESMNYIRPFMQTFRQTWPAMPLVEYDERFTSTLAHRAMIDGGMKRSQRRDKAVVDKIAACIILEGYLDSLGN
jgi:putative Holliday junction resolvase